MVDVLKKIFGGKNSGLNINLGSKIEDGEKMEIIDLIPDLFGPNFNQRKNYYQILKHFQDFIIKFLSDNYFMVVDDMNEKDETHVRVCLTKNDVVVMSIFRFKENDYKIYFISHHGNANEVKALLMQLLMREANQF